MKVFVAAPIRNREWILSSYLYALENTILKSGVQAQYYFILNDCIDESEIILSRFKYSISRPMSYDVVSNDIKTEHQRGSYSIENLAKLRNNILDKFLESGADYLFSVDSDIIVKKGTLRKLVERKKDVVAALVSNEVGKRVYESKYFNFLVDRGDGELTPYGYVPTDKLFRVNVTGAVVLISRNSLLKSGASYCASKYGEDYSFCLDLIDAGIDIFVDSANICDHRMIEKL